MSEKTKNNLTKTEEEELFEKLLESDWLEDELKEIEKEVEEAEFCEDENDLINKSKWVLTRSQERWLFNRLKETDDEIEKQWIRNYLVFKNIKLVYSVMKKNLYWFDKNDIFEQWISWVYSAIDRFKIEKEYKFSTYAIWYIRKFIQDYAIEFKFWFKITWHKMNEMSKIKRINEEYQQEHWELPSYEELLNRSWLSKKTFDSAYTLIATNFKSIDSNPYDWSDSMSMHNILVWSNLEEEINEKESIKMIKEASMRVLRPIEKTIFDKLNWFDIEWWFMVWEEQEADEIAEFFWIDKAEVRKINRQAKEKLKSEVQRMLWNSLDEEESTIVEWYWWEFF